MSLSVGQVRLQDAYKVLKTKWRATKTEWDDPMSRDFEEQHLAMLDQQVRAAIAGMEDVAEQLWRARRECE